MTKDIETGEISCGVVFNAEFSEKLKEQDYHHCITLYLPEGMNVGGMVQEDLFRKVYQAYSAVWYAELLEQQGYGVKPEEVLRKFSEYQSEGKVFVVDYEVLDGKGTKLYYEAESENEEFYHKTESEDEKFYHKKAGEDEKPYHKSEGYHKSEETGDTFYHGMKAGNETSLLSLRGILAFLTLLSASLGALDGSRDRKRGAGKGMADAGVLAMAAVGAPIMMATLFLTGGMILDNIKMTLVSENGSRVEEMTGIVLSRLIQAGVLQELVSAFVYGLILWLFAVVLSRFVPEKLLEGAMPCFLLIVLLCCPVFFDLGETIPVIRYLSNAFPVTWYLRFWG